MGDWAFQKFKKRVYINEDAILDLLDFEVTEITESVVVSDKYFFVMRRAMTGKAFSNKTKDIGLIITKEDTGDTRKYDAIFFKPSTLEACYRDATLLNRIKTILNGKS